jgi:hypothetical protein
MRRKLKIVIPFVVLVVAAGLLATTNASGQSALRVVAGALNDVRAVDVGGDGLRLGDRIAARGPLFEETQTQRVGTTYVHCIVHRRIIDPDKGLWNCNYVLDLAGGDLMLQGLDPRGPGVYEMSVLGGTGTYAGARGDATFTDVGATGDEYTEMEIRLRG